MKIALLDVNVLLSLLDVTHKFHGIAEPWFQRSHMNGWATCAITQAGFVRIAGNTGTPVQVGLSALETWCALPEHQFWHLDSPLSKMLPELRRNLYGPKQLTDAILLDLAIRKGGRLVTLDMGVCKLLPEDSPHQDAIEVIVP